jgi:hypothetical protein
MHLGTPPFGRTHRPAAAPFRLDAVVSGDVYETLAADEGKASALVRHHARSEGEGCVSLSTRSNFKKAPFGPFWFVTRVRRERWGRPASALRSLWSCSAVVLRELPPVPAIVGGVLRQVAVAISRRRTIRTHLDRAGDRQYRSSRDRVGR